MGLDPGQVGCDAVPRVVSARLLEGRVGFPHGCLRVLGWCWLTGRREITCYKTGSSPLQIHPDETRILQSMRVSKLVFARVHHPQFYQENQRIKKIFIQCKLLCQLSLNKRIVCVQVERDVGLARFRDVFLGSLN